MACFVESSKHSTQNQELSSLIFSSIVYTILLNYVIISTNKTDIIRFWRKHHWLSTNIQLNQWKKYVNILEIRFWKQMIPVNEFCKRCGKNQSRGDYVELVCTKVCRVKSMVFPVARYGCKSLTTKEAEH